MSQETRYDVISNLAVFLNKMQQSNNGLVLLAISFSINISIIVYVITDFFIHFRATSQKMNKHIERQTNLNSSHAHFLSFFLQVYEYILFLPSLQLSVRVEGHSGLRYINIFLISFIVVLIELVDYDIRIIPRDQLAKRPANLAGLRFILDGLSIIINHIFNDLLTVSLYNMIIHFVQIIGHLRVLQMIYPKMQTFIVQAHAVNLLFAFIINLPIGNEVFLSFILLAPCIMYAGQIASDLRQSNIIASYLDFFDSQDFDYTSSHIPHLEYTMRYLRQNVPIHIDDYFNSKQSVLIEAISNSTNKRVLIQIDRLQSVQNFIVFWLGINFSLIQFFHPTFLVSLLFQKLTQFQLNPQSDEDKQQEKFFLGFAERQRLVDTHLILSFQTYSERQINLEREQPGYNYFSYLSFLIECSVSQTVGISEILKLKNSRKRQLWSIRTQQVFQCLIDKHENQLSIAKALFSKQMYSQGKSEGSLSDTLYEVCEFDDQYDTSLRMLSECLQLKQEFILALGNDYIDLLILEQIATKLRLSRQRLSILLETLVKSNRKNFNVQKLCQIFEQALSYEERLKKVNDKQEKGIFGNAKEIRFSTNDSCVVFISLLKDFGKILKVSRNFNSVIPILTNEQALQSNVRDLISPTIAEEHDLILRDFAYRSSMLTEHSAFSCQIGISQQGWAIPYEARMQFHYILGGELGSAAWFRKIKDECQYIQVKILKNNSENPTSMSTRLQNKSLNSCKLLGITNSISFSSVIVALTKQLFYYLFDDSIVSPRDILKISVAKIIPQLQFLYQKHIKSQNQLLFNMYHTIYFIAPTSSQQLFSSTLFPSRNPSYVYDVNKSNRVFSAQCRFYKSNTPRINLITLQIKELQLINDPKEKLAAINDIFTTTHQTMNQEQSESPKADEKLLTMIEGSLNQRLLTSNQLFQQPDYILQSKPEKSNRSQISTVNIELKKTVACDPIPTTARTSISTQYKFDFIPRDINKPLVKSNKQPSSKNNIINRIEQSPTSCINLFQTEGYLSPTVFSEANSFLRQQFNKKNIRKSTDTAANLMRNSISTSRTAPKASLIGEKIKKQVTHKFHEANNIKEVFIKAGSISSSEIKCNKQRKAIQAGIESRNPIIGLKVINWVGIAAFLVIFIIIITSFINTSSFLSQQRQQFHYLSWSSDLRIAQSIIMSNLYLGFIILVNTIYLPAERQIPLLELAFTDMKETLKSFSNLIGQFTSEINGSGIIVFQQLLEKKFTYYVTSQTKWLLASDSYTGIKTTLGTAFLMQSANLNSFRQAPYQIDFNDYIMAEYNQDPLNLMLFDIQESVFEQYSSQIYQLKNTLLFDLIRVMVITLIFALSIIPIYAFFQRKREDILRLMATISPDHLTSMLRCTAKAQDILNKHLNIQLSLESSSRRINAQSQINQVYSPIVKKKRSTSLTSSILKINWSFLASALLFFLILQIYTVSMFFFLNYYLETSINNRKLMNNFSESSQYINNMVGSNYMAFYAKASGFPILFSEDFFVSKPVKYFSHSNAHLSMLLEYQQNLRSNPMRYEQETYVKYVTTMMEGNICQIANIFPQFNNDSFNIDTALCELLDEGMMKQGLLLAVRKIFQFQGLLVDAFSITSASEFKAVINTLFSEELRPEELNQLTKLLTLFFKQLIYFFEHMTLTLFDYIQIVHICVLIVQITAVFFTLYFGWWLFYRRVQELLHQTKLLLDLLDPSYLQENPYFVSYLKANQEANL